MRRDEDSDSESPDEWSPEMIQELEQHQKDLKQTEAADGTVHGLQINMGARPEAAQDWEQDDWSDEEWDEYEEYEEGSSQGLAAKAKTARDFNQLKVAQHTKGEGRKTRSQDLEARLGAKVRISRRWLSRLL